MKDSLQEATELNSRLVALVQRSHRVRRQALFHRHVVDCPDCVSEREPWCASALALLHEVPAIHPMPSIPADEDAPSRRDSLYNHDFRKRFSWGLAVAVGMGAVLEILDLAGLLSVPQ